MLQKDALRTGTEMQHYFDAKRLQARIMRVPQRRD